MRPCSDSEWFSREVYNNDLNPYNDKGRDAYGDKVDDYIDSYDDCDSFPYNIWSYSEYYGFALNNQNI